MRAYEILNEKTTENMEVLRDCVDLLIKNLPYKFKANMSDGLQGDRLSGLNEIIKKYAGTRYEEPVKALYQQVFVFNNNMPITGTLGAYIGRPHNIFKFNISGLMGECRDFTLEELLAFKGNKAIKTFRGIILHEIRHMFQSVMYKNYFYGGRDDDYKKSPIEIDAAWVHHLEDYNIDDFTTAESYANVVMSSFAGYKNLTPKEQEHFRRKTIRYYQDHTTGNKSAAGSNAKERLLLARSAAIKLAVNALAKVRNDYDLRNVPGYNKESKFFLFPDRAFRGAASILSSDARVTAVNAPIICLALALTMPPEDKPLIQKLLKSKGVTAQEALSNADEAFADGWDIPAIKSEISKAFD
jgi:hypothetical protein